MAKSTPIEIRTSSGGKLLSGPSSEAAGIANWTIKRDFRRELDGEVRSEGYDSFAPDPLNPVQPDTKDEAITLVAMARQPNGRTAVIVGTKTTLYRYFGLENGAYFEDGYFEAGYFDDNPGVWITIGSGFSPTARRWEAVSINGYLVLNNGVDLPVTYRVEEMEAKPIYELREQGIASVGTIAEHNGILVCGDIRQLDAERHVVLMSTLPVGEASQAGAMTSGGSLAVVNSSVAGEAGNTITATNSQFNGGSGFSGTEGWQVRMANGLSRTIASVASPTVATLEGGAEVAEPDMPFWLPKPDESDFILSQLRPDALLSASGLTDVSPLVGLSLFWDSGDVRTITAISGENIVVDQDSSIPPGPCRMENPAAYAAFTDPAHIERYHWRLLWSMPQEPRRFGAVIPCTITPSSNTVRLKYPIRSLENGQDILIVGAGDGGGNLTASAQWVMPNSVTVGEGAIVAANSALRDALTQAKTTQVAARAVVSSIQSTLQDAQSLLAQARADLAAAPEDSEDLITLKAAVSDASGKVNDAQSKVAQADASLEAATAARLKAEATAIPTDTQLIAADAQASITGQFEDLQGNGDGILKMLTLRNALVIYKETEIFLATYTGQVATPFVFERVPISESAALYFRNSLVSAGGLFHIYAARHSFYRFDLTNRLPTEIPEFLSCQGILFDNLDTENLGPELDFHSETITHGWNQATYAVWEGLDPTRLYQLNLDGGLQQVSGPTVRAMVASDSVQISSFSLREILTLDVAENVFAADNPLTRELFFFFPSNGPDKALRYDYRFNTLSTTSMECSAAAALKRPESQITLGKTEDWFVMGTSWGELLRYGLVAGGVERSGSVTASKTSGTVTASQGFFTPRMVGRSIVFADGRTFAITGYWSPTQVVAPGQGDVASQAFSISPAIYHRDGAPYESVLQSGMEAFGAPDSEKRLDRYVLGLASDSASTPIRVGFRAGANPANATEALSTTIDSPQTRNLVPLILLSHYLGDSLSIDGVNNPAKVVSRSFSVAGVNSRSFNRRPE